MIHFESDYTEGAHEAVLNRLIETNFEQLPGYGTDKYCESAKRKIKEACGREDAEVYLLTGGTQTNQIVIDTMIHATEGAVSADTGHINVHESGAVEFTGHKILPLPNFEGKIHAEDLKKLLVDFYADGNREHCVFPGIVYVSHPTEYGTLYTKAELSSIAKVCREYEIPLFLDGARLGFALSAAGNDLSLRDIAELCDVFYIGGTKVGALCGEAVVFTHGNAPRHFTTSIKQHGALLAKGRLLGVQFDTLFTDGLYLKIGEHANKAAEKLRRAFREKGYRFHIETVTNQIFVVLDKEQIEHLSKHVVFSVWEKPDEEHTVVRFATSFATKDSDVDYLINLL